MNKILIPDHFQTPMMVQYLEIKKQYPDCILFFRLGDFYEMFLEDAKIGSEILDITLTARNRGKDGAIPMAGVPYHAVDSYLSKLVSAGYKVAICDQTSLPDGKGLVDREVIRVITPGTNINTKGLEKKKNSYVIAILFSKSLLTIGICDISTGEVSYLEEKTNDYYHAQQLIDDLFSKIQPIEGIVNQEFYFSNDKMSLFNHYPNFFVYHFEDWEQYTKDAQSNVLRVYDETNLRKLNLEDKKSVVTVLGVLFGYLQYTQKVDLKHIQKLEQFSHVHFLEMDRSTIGNLELISTLNGDTKHTLLDLIDFTHTGMGGRLLKKWIVRPLAERQKINDRLAITEKISLTRDIRTELITSLKKINDIERIISRLSLKFGNPRDLVSLKNSLQEAAEIHRFLKNDVILNNLVHDLAGIKKVISLIDTSIVNDPPLNPKNGGFIKDGVNAELDTLKTITLKSRDWMDDFEIKERKRTGISSLKVKFNKVFGFYIEISKSNLTLVPSDYERKQTLVNAERFITEDLKKHEQIVLEAEEKIFEIEYRIFLKLVDTILMNVGDMQQIAREIGNVDCLVSFALASIEYGFSKPTITDENILEIKAGRHPVVEKIIGKHNFVPNDTTLDQKNQQLIVITGPNMAGKSVLMRQTALIVLLSHMGCFVPATQAKIGLTDKIFVRSGASDAITEGLSTFMVEMVETARILTHATERSLVIMDEIGRGTSTYDGISIAWSVAEKLVKDKQRTPKTLFATHYHELQELEEQFSDKITNYHMEIESHNQEPVFLYVFKKGYASHSFGIQVAQRAGLPHSVISRAKELLQGFEKELPSGNATALLSQNRDSQPHEETQVIQQLREIDVNTLTPLESLQKLHQLVEKYGKN